MPKAKLANSFILAIIIGIAWYADTVIPSANTAKIFQTSVTLFFLYLLFEVVLKHIILGQLKGYRQRYSGRKAVSLIYAAILLITLFAIWIENVQALLVAYGLIAAGVAVSLQDMFKNIMGGIILLFRGTFSAGDRIEVDGVQGDVIDVGIMYTTILEIKNWVMGDQATGRLTYIPNGKLLGDVVHNYTKDNSITWDELMLPLTFDSDWQKAADEITEMVKKETAKDIDLAEKDIQKLSSRYYLSPRDASPEVYIKLTDNWIELHLRYVTTARERRITQDHLHRQILLYIDKQKDIKIASTTLDIIGFPKS